MIPPHLAYTANQYTGTASFDDNDNLFITFHSPKGHIKPGNDGYDDDNNV